MAQLVERELAADGVGRRRLRDAEPDRRARPGQADRARRRARDAADDSVRHRAAARDTQARAPAPEPGGRPLVALRADGRAATASGTEAGARCSASARCSTRSSTMEDSRASLVHLDARVRCGVNRRLMRLRSICFGSGLSSRACASHFAVAAAGRRASVAAGARADGRREDQGRRPSQRRARPRRAAVRLGQRLRRAVPAEDRPEDEQGRRRRRGIGNGSCGLGYGAGSLWIEDTSSSTVSRVSVEDRQAHEGDPGRHARRTTRRSPTARRGRRRTASGEVERIDPAKNKVVKRWSSSARRSASSARSARSGRAGSEGVLRIDPAANKVRRDDPRRERRLDGRLGRRGLGDDDRRASPASTRDERGRARPIPIGGGPLGDPAVVGGKVWVPVIRANRSRSSTRRRTPSGRRQGRARARSSSPRSRARPGSRAGRASDICRVRP